VKVDKHLFAECVKSEVEGFIKKLMPSLMSVGGLLCMDGLVEGYGQVYSLFDGHQELVCNGLGEVRSLLELYLNVGAPEGKLDFEVNDDGYVVSNPFVLGLMDWYGDKSTDYFV